MELMNAMNISASGMKAQGMRMRIISENMANSETTPDKPGIDPYRRKIVTFKNVLDRESGVNKVQADDIRRDQAEFRMK
jgi:flagellar basal-body rod protein FlgC